MHIIGVDEAGRGPLAGPVVVGAVALPFGFRLRRAPGDLRDSKRLTRLMRERWFAYIMNTPDIRAAVSFVTPGVIDRIRITRATNRAATRAVLRLERGGIHVRKARIFTDGLLRLSHHLPYREVIGGDELLRTIQLASIVAKVTRDWQMERLHERYPAYGFARHKGYGTREHYRMIHRHGPSEAHRLTFLEEVM